MTSAKHVCFWVKRIPLIFSQVKIRLKKQCFLDIIFVKTVQWLKLMFIISRSFKMTLHPIFNYIFSLQRHMGPENMSNRKKTKNSVLTKLSDLM